MEDSIGCSLHARDLCGLKRRETLQAILSACHESTDGLCTAMRHLMVWSVQLKDAADYSSRKC